MDLCRCCRVCAKDVGQDCNGPWGELGKCGRGLTCVKRPPPDEAYGVCKVCYSLEWTRVSLELFC